MKRFNLHGNTANWDALKVVALNTDTREFVTRTAIPSDMKITVHVVDNFYRVYDKQVRQILHGEISSVDQAKLIGECAATPCRPDFMLFHEEKCIGYANFHHRHRIKTFKATLSYTVSVPISVRARTEAEALERLNEIGLAAAKETEEENPEKHVTFDGASITDIVRD